MVTRDHHGITIARRVLCALKDRSGSATVEYGLIAAGLSVSIAFIVLQLALRP